MKRMLILILAVLGFSVALCTFSLLAMNRTVDGAERLHNLAVLAVERGELSQAGSLMAELASFWRDNGELMKLLADHDALQDVEAGIAEARICLEFGDRDDFLRTMSNVAAGLSNLRDDEALQLSNLY